MKVVILAALTVAWSVSISLSEPCTNGHCGHGYEISTAGGLSCPRAVLSAVCTLEGTPPIACVPYWQQYGSGTNIWWSLVYPSNCHCTGSCFGGGEQASNCGTIVPIIPEICEWKCCQIIPVGEECPADLPNREHIDYGSMFPSCGEGLTATCQVKPESYRGAGPPPANSGSCECPTPTATGTPCNYRYFEFNYGWAPVWTMYYRACCPNQVPACRNYP